MTTTNRSDIEVSVIIPCISFSEGLRALLKSVRNQTDVKIKDVIVVLRDFSEQETAFPLFEGTFLKQSGNGRAEAINLGTKHAKGNVFVFVDDDCLPANDKWLMTLTQSFLENSNTGIVSGRLIVPSDSYVQAFIQSINGLGTPDYGDTDFLVGGNFISFSGTNLAMRRLTYLEVGGFDENLIVGEDLDFCLRAFKKNVTMRYSSDAIVYHLHRRNFVSLIKHGWKTGKGSIGLIKKNGFIGGFLKGTPASVLSVLLTPLFVYVLWLSFQIRFLIFGIGLTLLISYACVAFELMRKSSFGIRNIVFPGLLGLYGYSVGLGFVYQTIYNSFKRKRR